MEEDEQNIQFDDSNQLALKSMIIDKTKNEVKEEASSSKKSKKEEKDEKNSVKSPVKEQDITRTKTPTPARSSPEPSCAICLEQLQNKSFTDSCFHMFCFTCLVEWSKVKPECPLCKQSFKSIVHNVRSFKDFDQYYINKNRISENLWNCITDRRFRYSTTLTPERLLERSHTDYSDRIESEIASHRMRYAPHSVHPVRMYASSQSVSRVPCTFRRRVYAENIWVRRQPSSRVRCISPAFFRRNIACTHRLLPWLNRELLVVMPNNESQISFVIELIMALIVKYEITSQEFYTHIEPYTAGHTSHFIHEFYNFAVSPYETMETYDQHAQYSTVSFEAFPSVSSPDSDVIPLSTNETSAENNASNESKRKKHRSKKKIVMKLKTPLNNSVNNSAVGSKIILVRKRGSWSSSVVSDVPFSNLTDVSSTNPFEIPGPSTSRDTRFPDFASESTSQENLDESNDVQCLGVKEDEECQVVEVLKPKCDRTPEIVDLSSDDETENVRNEPSLFDDDSCLYDGMDPAPAENADENTSDDDIIFVSETKVSESSPEKPIDYSMKTSEKETAEGVSKQQEIDLSSSSSKDNAGNENPGVSKVSVIQSTIRTLNIDNDTGSSSWSPAPRPKKRRAILLEDSSTESCSESAQVSEIDTKIKKLKLRSVVAHFSIDPSDNNDSTHHSSSHKKHKDKKKKKKKHKHRRRIYSSDSN